MQRHDSTSDASRTESAARRLPDARRPDALAWTTIFVVFALPFFYGAVHTPVRVAYIAVSALLFATHVGVNKKLWPGGLVGKLLLGIGVLLFLSVIPLPNFLVRLVSPSTFQWAVTDLRTAGIAVGWFHSLALSADQAYLAVATAYAHLMMLGVVWGVARERKFALRISGAVVASSTVIGLLAIFQTLTGARAIYWIGLERGQFYGTFVNGNHTSTFLAAGAVIALGLAVTQRDVRWRASMAVAAGVCAAATVFSFSRGGVIALAVGLVALVATTWVRRRNGLDVLDESKPRTFFRQYGLSIALLFVGVLYFAWLGPADIAREVSTLAALDLPSDYRTLVWKDSMDAFGAFWFVGAGPGNFTAVFPTFRTFMDEVTAQSAESELIQLLVELGVVGTVLVVGAWLAVLVGVFRNLAKVSSLAIGTSAALCAIGVHALFDFPMRTTAVAVVAVVCAGVAIRSKGTDRFGRGWWAFPVATLLLMALGLTGPGTERLRDPDRIAAQIRARPQQFVAYVDLANLKDERYDAGVLFAIAERRSPVVPFTVNAHAKYLAQQGEFEAADAAFGRLIELVAKRAPSSLSAFNLARYVTLGEAALYGGDLERAQQYFEWAQQIDGRDPDALMGLGDVALAEGWYDFAEMHYWHVVVVRPERIEKVRGRLLGTAANRLAAGNVKSARRWLQVAAAVEPDPTHLLEALGEVSTLRTLWAPGPPAVPIEFEDAAVMVAQPRVRHRYLTTEFSFKATNKVVIRMVVRAPMRPGEQLALTVGNKRVHGGRVTVLSPGRYEIVFDNIGTAVGVGTQVTQVAFDTRGIGGTFTFESLELRLHEPEDSR